MLADCLVLLGACLLLLICLIAWWGTLCSGNPFLFMLPPSSNLPSCAHKSQRLTDISACLPYFQGPTFHWWGKTKDMLLYVEREDNEGGYRGDLMGTLVCLGYGWLWCRSKNSHLNTRGASCVTKHDSEIPTGALMKMNSDRQQDFRIPANSTPGWM